MFNKIKIQIKMNVLINKPCFVVYRKATKKITDKQIDFDYTKNNVMVSFNEDLTAVQLFDSESELNDFIAENKLIENDKKD